MTERGERREPRKHHAAATVTNVSVTIDNQRLLSNVTVEIARASVTAIIGPNGAGKSTLIGVLAGDIRVESGTVKYCRSIATAGCINSVTEPRATRDSAPRGTSVRGNEYESVATLRIKDLARRRSVILQQAAVAFAYTVREVVTMGRAAWNVTDVKRDEKIVNHAMDQTDTLCFADREITTLSGGENARVAVARVLAQDTPLILLDEPTAALDIVHQERVLELARFLAKTGGSVVLVMHDLDAAAAHADHVIVLAAGRVIASGLTREIMTSELLTEVYEHPIDVVKHPTTGRPLISPARGLRRFTARPGSAAACDSRDQIDERCEDHGAKEVRQESVMERRSAHIE